jgi:hypothetical protein
VTRRRLRDRRGLLDGLRWGGGLTAALALVALMAIGPAPARADAPTDSYNQMTGGGSTSSALTVKWADGLLNAQNQPITNDTTDRSPDSDRSAASPTSPLSFMYGDFKNLAVTVSQTENITHQGITVSWTGGLPTVGGTGNYYENFLQIMECYGDSASGPSPEGCEFGSDHMLQPANYGITERTGLFCGAGTVPSTTNPPGGMYPYQFGCDPYEPTTETPAHCDPTPGSTQTCATDNFFIPFVSADDPTNQIYGTVNLPKEFDRFNSNEIQAAATAANGTGTRQFETLTANQSPGLGCGEVEPGGQTRNCWLVIVPRGKYEPNGYQVDPDGSNTQINTSPLSAGNWAQRIQIHLDYAPLASTCPPNVVPDQMVGSQVVYRAVASWQQALNQAAQCARVFSFTASTENEATTQLATGGAGTAGLAFTTIPIGSETARHGGSPPTLPNILYAPVAVTALDFGFNINRGAAGADTTPVNLTPSLVAKALTQVYKQDLPDYDPPRVPGPAWVQNNPLNITLDPSFTALNPTSVVSQDPDLHTLAPLLVGDLSADNQRVWNWIQADSATASWLDGKSTSNPVTVDPDYVSLDLGSNASMDSFPEAYTGTITCADVASPTECGSKGTAKLNSEDMIPVETNFDQATAAVLAGSNPTLLRDWLPLINGPDNKLGWWNAIGSEPPGAAFMWTMADMPDLAAYGIVSAALCDSSGAHCVQPSTASVTTAVNAATKDSAGLLEVNPADVPAGGYPLTDVVYAAISTDQPASVLSNYADFVSYAAGQGQTAGSAPGDLPPGYLPLPANLQAQAKSVVQQLRAIASPSPSPSTSKSASSTVRATHSATATGSATHSAAPTPVVSKTSSNPGSGSQSSTPQSTASMTQSSNSGGTTGNGATTGSGGTSASSATASATSSASVGASATPSPAAAGPSISPPGAELVSGTTPHVNVGGIRAALVIVLIIGAAGAVGGSALRFGSLAQLSQFRRRISRR